MVIRNSLKLAATLVVLGIVSIVGPETHERWLQQRARSGTRRLGTDTGSSATGFYAYTPQGREVMVTAAHVCEGADLIFNTSTNEPVSYRKIVRRTVDDVCILKVRGERTPGHTFAVSSSEAVWGEKIYTFGYPFAEGPYFKDGRAGYNTPAMVPVRRANSEADCRGVGEAFTIAYPYGGLCYRVYHTTFTSINGFPGNSGGPVFDMYGQIVGLISLGDGRMNILSYVPVSKIRDALRIADSVLVTGAKP